MALICETPRLRLRTLTVDHSPFMHRLMNDEAWLRHIGDRNVPTVAATARYLEASYIASYAQHGFGMWLVELIKTGEPLGVCGLVQRDYLPEPDLGFGFAPEARRHGFGFEAAEAVLGWAAATRPDRQLLAVTSPDNRASIALLGHLGFVERDDLLQLLPEPGRIFSTALG
ncbi:MAG: GNAT family N-acetyltransferase [Pseudomonadota bacterium]